MKTGAALRVERFRAAEPHARRSGKSGRRLHTDAIASSLAGQASDEVTEAMDRVVGCLGDAASDDFVACATLQTLQRLKW